MAQRELTERQKKAEKWWRSLSLNQWKDLEKKHNIIFTPPHKYDIEKMYITEH